MSVPEDSHASHSGIPVEHSERSAARPTVSPQARESEGLPLDRAPTREDVRGGAGSGSSVAASCALVVLIVLAGFWTVRGCWLG